MVSTTVLALDYSLSSGVAIQKAILSVNQK